MSRILLVDDDANLRDALSAVLDGAGHNVTVAQDGLAALRVAPKFSPQVIITDITMPSIDGPELVRRIKAMRDFEQIPVIMMTALATAPTVPVAFMLRKPFAPAELLRLLDKLPDVTVVSGEHEPEPRRVLTAELVSQHGTGPVPPFASGEKVQWIIRLCQAHIRRGNELVQAQEDRLRRLRSLGIDTGLAEQLHGSMKHYVAVLVLFEPVIENTARLLPTNGTRGG